MKPLVGIIMGSSSDWETMRHAADLLTALSVPFETRVVSAHRTPDLLFEYASGAAARGIEVLIAGAGGAAHLPGMTAVEDLAAGHRRADPVEGAERARFAAVDRADARRHPGRDGRDRRYRREECGAVRRRGARGPPSAIAGRLRAYRERQTADVLAQPDPAGS